RPRRSLDDAFPISMQVAQRLYEAGHITYMRTDSVNLSDTAIQGAQDEILKAYGEKYHKKRKYKTKSSGAQEAHEAIRPTYFANHSISAEPSEVRLYELIWKRAIASQMSEAEFEKNIAKIAVSTSNKELIATVQIMKVHGFLKFYME